MLNDSLQFFKDLGKRKQLRIYSIFRISANQSFFDELERFCLMAQNITSGSMPELMYECFEAHTTLETCFA